MERILVRVQGIFNGDYCCAGLAIEFIESLLHVGKHCFIGLTTGCCHYFLMDGGVDFCTPSSRFEPCRSLGMVVHTSFYTSV